MQPTKVDLCSFQSWRGHLQHEEFDTV